MVTGSILVSSPAQAATASIGVTDPVVYSDTWSSGIDVTGGGFTPNSTVTLSLDWVDDSTATKVHLADTTTQADASGTVSVVGWIPTQAPGSWADSTLTLSATSDALDTSNAVAFDVRNPPGIETNAPSLTTAQFMDPALGLLVEASGFTPGEAVTFSAVYNGENLPAPASIVADKYGSIFWQYVRPNSAAAGSVVLDAAGATVHWRATVAITGATIGGSPAPAASADPEASKPATPRALPVVSG
ncbi:hypothetical protein [Leifsonia sp. 2MCAF36]|uniref:hypothetical protein n=1 Tax=Leifsonia sp. 2MCAF36 TaxID=3232988 RepID=UPI003F9DFEB8